MMRALLLALLLGLAAAFRAPALAARRRGLAPLRGAVSEVTTEEFERVVAEGKPTVVDVYAKWCGPWYVHALESARCCPPSRTCPRPHALS